MTRNSVRYVGWVERETVGAKQRLRAARRIFAWCEEQGLMSSASGSCLSDGPFDHVL